MRVLLFSTLYPNAERPGHGVFVENRLRAVLEHAPVQTRVVAPVPWFPCTGARFGEYARWARAPRMEQRHGIDVRHPRYALLPKVGMSIAPTLLALGAWRTLKALRHEGFDFDLIDAHYAYPDGVAAALLARWCGRPFTITARGSDVNLIAQHATAHAQMRWSWQRAGAVVGVSQALCDRLRALGAPPARVHCIPNGIDTRVFHRVDHASARHDLGLSGSPLLLFVGNLLPVKQPELAIAALARLLPRQPQAQLAIVGDGPLRGLLQQQVSQRGLDAHVRFMGAVPHTQLHRWYSACDMLLLTSRSEGWPNVVLESLACGAPVIGAAVGGIPEIIRAPVLGRLVHDADEAGFAEAIEDLLGQPIDRAACAAFAAAHGWQAQALRVVATWQKVRADAAACFFH